MSRETSFFEPKESDYLFVSVNYLDKIGDFNRMSFPMQKVKVVGDCRDV